MAAEDKVNEIAAKLRAGVVVPPITVREFLSWFGAERRGSFIVWWIRSTLEGSGLETRPDFQSAYIGSLISFVLSEAHKQLSDGEEASLSGAADLAGTDSALLATTVSYADPMYRISKLEAANNPPVYVVPDATVQHAVTVMLTNDFSQLPVMTNERDVKGVVSWTSIGTRLALGKNGNTARELMDAHQEIRAEASIFQAIPIIVAYQYVLVRGSDNKIAGIVTASDLSLQFQQLAEPFLLLGEIENHIRRILSERFARDDFESVRDPSDGERTINGVADLTFGEYIRLLEREDQWAKLGIPIDRVTLCKELDRVRTIRNDVMHFDPDGIPSDDLKRLRDFAAFLQRLHAIGVPS